MARLKIKDAPLLPVINGDEKIPTGGKGDFTVTPNMLAEHFKSNSGFATDAELVVVDNKLKSHTDNKNNPHQTTKEQVGLGNVDNTSDIDKPISNATSIALDNKADKSTTYTKTEVDGEFLSIYQNGAALPYDAAMEYAEGAVVVKDGELQKKQGASWVSATNKGYNLDYFVSGKSYPLHAEIMLESGDIVKSTITNNTNDPNIDMTGWSLDDNTVESIAQLRVIDPKKKGARVYLKSVVQDKDLGGGMFVSTQKVGLADNGGTIISSPDPALFWVRINYDNVIPQFWGALGDTVNDDRPAFQSAVNYLHSIGGGELLAPKPVSGYRWKSYDSVESACLVVPSPLRSIYVDPITIRGAGNLIDIKVNLPLGASILSAVLYKGGGLYNKLENLSIWGGATSTTPQCDYVVKASDAYYPNMTIRDCQFYVAKEDCLKLSTYVTVLDKVQTAYSKRGFVVNKIDSMVEAGTSGPITSITLNSCYALEHTHNGYWFGEATYCAFNACAADHIINTTGDGYEAYPYYFDIARSVTMNGCGAESSTRILRVRAAQGLIINGIMTLSIGDNTTPPNSLIYIEGGDSATISGIWKQNSKGFQNVLRVGNTFGREAVTVLDESIKSTECTWVANFGHERPIRFVCEDFTVKTHDLPVTNTGNAATNTANLSAWFALNYSREYLHDLIIRLPSGDFPISAKSYLVDKYNRGYGRIRLIGHADGTSRIVTTGDGGLVIGVPNKLAPTYVTVENATIHMQTPNGTTKGLELYNTVLSLVGGKITSDNGTRQYYSDNSSKIMLDSTSQITTAYTGLVNVEFAYKATTPPTTSTRLPVGTTFKASDPNTTRYAWINTVDGGATWLPIAP